MGSAITVLRYLVIRFLSGTRQVLLVIFWPLAVMYLRVRFWGRRSYHVALSFYSKDSDTGDVADRLAREFKRVWIKVFYYKDPEEAAKTYGHMIEENLTNIYGTDSHQVILIGSPNYGRDFAENEAGGQERRQNFTGIEWRAIRCRRQHNQEEDFLLPVSTVDASQLPEDEELSGVAFAKMPNDRVKRWWENSLEIRALFDLVSRRLGRRLGLEAIWAGVALILVLAWVGFEWYSRTYVETLSKGLLFVSVGLFAFWGLVFHAIPRRFPQIVNGPPRLLRWFPKIYWSPVWQPLLFCFVLCLPLVAYAGLPSEEQEIQQAMADWLGEDEDRQAVALHYFKHRLGEDRAGPIWTEFLGDLKKGAAERRRALELICRFEDPLRHLDSSLAYREDLTVRSFVLEHLIAGGLKPQAILDWLEAHSSQRDQDSAAVRQALILALGRCNQSTLSELLQFPPDAGNLEDDLRDKIAEALLKAYRDDPDPGVHSAIDWLLRRWDSASNGQAGYTKRIGELDEEFARNFDEGDFVRQLAREPYLRRWYVTRKLHTMTVVRLTDSSDKPYWLAISSKEVTNGQFNSWTKERAPFFVYNPTPSAPAVSITAQAAMGYCRWLNDELNPQGHGYRLPTGGEWLSLCRAGTTTDWFYGNASDLITERGSPTTHDALWQYAWYRDHYEPRKPSKERMPSAVGQLMPNPWGLFDVYGNVREWCQPSLWKMIVEGWNYPALGGSFLKKKGDLLKQDGRPNGVAFQDIGFRIARTLTVEE